MKMINEAEVISDRLRQRVKPTRMGREPTAVIEPYRTKRIKRKLDDRVRLLPGAQRRHARGAGGVTVEPLPELLDARHLAAELGVTRAAAEKMMRRLPLVEIPGLRKVYVKRADVVALLESSTVESGRPDQ